MPTTNPRLTVTFSPSMATVLDRLSELSGQSRSSIIAEIIEGTQPVMERMIQVLEAAQKAKASLRTELTRGFDDAEGELNKQLGITMDIFNDVSDSFIERSEAIGRRATTGRATGDAQRHLASASTALPPLLTGGSQTSSVVKRTIKSSKVRPFKAPSTPSEKKVRG